MQECHLSIVIYSALLSHGGGRETWLNNILPKLLEIKKFSKISIYYFSDAVSHNEEKISAIQDKRLELFNTKLPPRTNRLSTLKRLANFYYKTIVSLRKTPSKNHLVLAVGTYHESTILALLKATMLTPPKTAIWIRGILSKEINNEYNSTIQKVICHLEKRCISNSNFIISNGEDTKHHYEELLGRHVEAIPNAVNIEKYKGILEPAFKKRIKKIAYIGRLTEVKGLSSYLDSISLFMKNTPSNTILFEIVGDGPLREKVEKFIEANPNFPVRFLGAISNDSIPQYLASIDAAVNLTYSRQIGGGGVSNGLVELIAAERLVVAWDSPIFKQVLDNTQALYVNENDNYQLALSFNQIDNHPELMKEKIKKSSEILYKYSMDVHVNKFIDHVLPKNTNKTK